MEQTKQKPTLDEFLRKQEPKNHIPNPIYVGETDNLIFVQCPECNTRMPERNYPQHYKAKHK